MEELKIIKIGGELIANEPELHQALEIFSGLAAPKILVHGGGSTADKILDRLGIKPKLVDGRRITDADSLSVVQMVYAGLINKNIVARLQTLYCPAIGLSGADADTIRAVKRSAGEINYGFVGDISKVHVTAIKKILDGGFIPVFCALTHDGAGGMLNTNADTIATELAIALSSVYSTKLYFCFEKPGVLLNPDDPYSLISYLGREKFLELIQKKIIRDGMVPKIENALRASEKGVAQVVISHHSALAELNLKNNIMGTQIGLGDA